MHKKIDYKFLIIPNDANLSAYNSTSFILPLKNYSVGFERYYDENEVNALSKKYNISIIINKFLHKEDVEELKTLLLKLDNINYYIIEDFSLTSFLPKENIVLYPNHIICNYESVNYLKTLGYNNIFISNELTIRELESTTSNTKSNLFYMYLGKNQLMYSKRKLLSNYFDNYGIDNKKKFLIVNEKCSNSDLIIKEEGDSTTIFYNKIFCASKYIEKLSSFNLVVNFNYINDDDKKEILKNMGNKKLCELINSDYKFLEENITYKVKEKD